MIGTYTFRQDGKIVAKQDNLITTLGKRVILDYLAKYAGSMADSIAIGTGTTAAALGDTMLGFEYARTSVSLVSADYSTTGVIFKGTLPATVAGTVYEAGLWTIPYVGSSVGSQMLVSFNQSTEPWSVGAFNTDATKIGGDALRLTATVSSSTTSALTGVFFDLSGYTSADKIQFAYQMNDANNASLKIRFKTDASNYYEKSITTANGSGYHIFSMIKSDFTATGTPSWANITIVEIVSTAGAGGTSVVDLDGIRVDVATPAPDNVLVSRVVLVTPLAKTNVRPMEVEYRLRVTL